jgi:hypothetical protein
VLGKKGQEFVRSPEDVEKLKIGMPKGASVMMAIQNMARATGVDFTKIEFVNLSPPDSVNALAKVDIDAMAGSAPWVFNAVKQAGGKVYFTSNPASSPARRILVGEIGDLPEVVDSLESEAHHAAGKPAVAACLRFRGALEDDHAGAVLARGQGGTERCVARSHHDNVVLGAIHRA